MRARTKPEDMVIYYLLKYRNKNEFHFGPSFCEQNEYRAAFEARGATVKYDSKSGLMRISHSELFRTLVSADELWEDRKTLIVGFVSFFGLIAAIIMACFAAISVGASAVTAWFGFLAALCIGGCYRSEKRPKA